MREPFAILDGQAEHLGDHDQRQRPRDVDHEIALATTRDVVDQLARELADVRHQLGDSRRREAAADHASLAGVLGIVHRHDRQRIGATSLRAHALLAAEQLRMPLDEGDVFVLGDDPQVVLVVAVHGIVLAHPRVDVVGHATYVQRGIERVDLERRRRRSGHESSMLLSGRTRANTFASSRARASSAARRFSGWGRCSTSTPMTAFRRARTRAGS